MAQDIEEIRTLLTHHQDVLTSGDVDEVLELYSAKAVLLAPKIQPAANHEAIREAYAAILSNMKHGGAFNIEEIVPTAPDWAFARTISEQTVGGKGKGKGRALEREASHGVLILRKGLDGWKIARCCFTATLSPPSS